uniref:NADH dehydrogenase subunit 4 n=1 Tax=Lema decempunctata TaxID=1412118 RepID=UPI0022A67EFF|nr:NADH dehydrogenase subunit 4 [Lema decempunctata]UZS91165.1 NADH dehydrogenase subunit 4 [Lema decempunctata]
MKFIFMMIFLMPLCFLDLYWLVGWLFFFMSTIYMYEFFCNFYIFNISYIFGLDEYSYFLVLLSFWICSLMILASSNLFNKKIFFKEFLLLMVMLMMSLYFTFTSLNLLIFYIFFEVSLIPTLILILGWGYQPERIEAGLYLLFYTLLMSLPMMIGVFFFYLNNGSLMFYFIDQYNDFIMYLCINMVFFCKMPMYFIHLWLPKAHVEAPVSGSMILAGILLKLGGYGLLRLLSKFLFLGVKVNFIFIVISLIGGILISLICLRQSDMKSLIAYSSVCHMGLVISGLMTLTNWGILGAFFMMIAHGLCSSGLFCLANIVYERVLTRSLYLSKGMINILPSLSLWWFMFCICNMAAPPSLNLFSEIMLINSLMSYNWSVIFLLSLLSFFSAAYSLILFSFSQHGAISFIYSFYNGFYREFLLLFLHWFPLNFLILKLSLMI